MLASAVVVPEDAPEPAPSLKRRQSSISSDASKRPRLDTNVSQQSIHGSPTHSSTTAMSPPPTRRKSSALGTNATEEKKRGQRLFGGLLGTLSQTSAKPAHRKRDEIEKRQQEKMRLKDEELAEEKRRKRAQIDSQRREEQKAWDEQSMRLRHQNMRATARFLKTGSQPQLYYKPWELRPEEEDQIKRQIDDVEKAITHELASHAAEKGAETGMNEVLTPAPSLHDTPTETEPQKPDGMLDGEQKTGSELVGDDTTNQQGSAKYGTDGANDTTETPSNQSNMKDAKDNAEEKPLNDDHGGEELVEGQEDDLIY